MTRPVTHDAKCPACDGWMIWKHQIKPFCPKCNPTKTYLKYIKSKRTVNMKMSHKMFEDLMDLIEAKIDDQNYSIECSDRYYSLRHDFVEKHVEEKQT